MGLIMKKKKKPTQSHTLNFIEIPKKNRLFVNV